MHLTGLFIYPVKSLRGCAVRAAEVDALGLVGDRRFLVVDGVGRFLTQRALPRMARIETALSDETLTLSAPSHGAMHVARAPDKRSPLRRVSIWKSDGLLAQDCGDGAAGWLEEVLGLRCRLVRVGPEFSRPVLKPTATPADRVGFQDAYPFMVLSEASLRDLNERLAANGEESVPMNRFRPNLVVTDCAAYAEDTWARVRIGEVTFRAGGPCARCVITTTDQYTAERHREPLHTLATYRRDPNNPTDVDFGQNLYHETKRGSIRVGDTVEVM
jgi:uncharacterized protein YcbX